MLLLAKMNWFVLATFSVITFSLADLFGKLSSDKINPLLGNFIITGASALISLFILIYFYLQGESISPIKPQGILFTTIAGISVGIASLLLFKAFASGANLSIVVPFVRTGMVIAAALLGVILLREGLSFKLIIGILFSLIGIYLISATK